MKPIFQKSSEELYWAISSYMAQLRKDNVQSIFCLQPMLSCRKFQKELSPLEKQLRKNVESNNQGATFPARFFNEDFTERLDSLAPLYKSHYIDMNKEIKSLTANDQFFADYCHLTPLGNRFVASKFADLIDTAILKDLVR